MGGDRLSWARESCWFLPFVWLGRGHKRMMILCRTPCKLMDFFLNTSGIKIKPLASFLTDIYVDWYVAWPMSDSHWALFLNWVKLNYQRSQVWRFWSLSLPLSFSSPMKAATSPTYLLCCPKLAGRWAILRVRQEGWGVNTIVLFSTQSFIF